MAKDELSMRERRAVRREAFRFFHEHAGWSEPPGRAACALGLARTEELLTRACAEGVARVRWLDDDAPYEPGDAWTEEEAARLFESGAWTGPFGCALEVGGETVASLWGIVMGPAWLADPYCRVVAAELADEAEDDLRQALGDALDAREETSAA